MARFSVQPLCSLCLCGCFSRIILNHRGTENTEVAQRRAMSRVLCKPWLTVLNLNCLGGNADDDVMRLDVARDDRARADHRVIADLRAGENGRVIGDTNAVSDLCPRGLD